MADRQSIVYSLIESALRAAADPSVTTVLRDWDYYPPGDSAQPLAPFLVVGVTDDTPYGVGIGLYRCSVQIMIAVADSPGIRDDFDRILASVRSVMPSLAHISAYGVTISATLEQGCTQPAPLNESGDIVFAQTLTFRVWFEASQIPPAVLDPEIFLVDRDTDSGVTYLTRHAADPRRIERWTPGTTLVVQYGYGAWSDKAELIYGPPLTPLSTTQPITVNPHAPSADQ